MLGSSTEESSGVYLPLISYVVVSLWFQFILVPLIVVAEASLVFSHVADFLKYENDVFGRGLVNIQVTDVWESV